MGGCGARWTVCPLLPSSLRHSYKTHIRGIYDTSYLSYLRSVLSLFYSPSSASPPLSHYTKTSGRVTPAGPVRQHRHLSSQALTRVRARRVRRSMAAGRARWWTLGGRAWPMAMRISETRSGDNCVGFCRRRRRSPSGGPPLMLVFVGVVQNVLLGWRHVLSEAPHS